MKSTCKKISINFAPTCCKVTFDSNLNHVCYLRSAISFQVIYVDVARDITQCCYISTVYSQFCTLQSIRHSYFQISDSAALRVYFLLYFVLFFFFFVFFPSIFNILFNQSSISQHCQGFEFLTQLMCFLLYFLLFIFFSSPACTINFLRGEEFIIF